MAEKKVINIRIPAVNFWMVLSIVLALGLVYVVFKGSPFSGMSVLSAQDAAKKAADYINANLIQSGSITVVSTTEANGVYLVTTSYQNQTIPVYVTKDGTLLFVGGYDLTKTTTQTTQPKKTCEDLKKASQPLLQAFVVSYCPYGLQMQRILVAVVENIPSLAQYIEVRYIGSVSNGKVTSMHGDQEATENLRQICIRKEQSDKFWPYISCFIKTQDSSSSCLTEAKVDTTALNACMSDANKGIKYASEDFSLTTQYQVSGSPTIILNGEQVSEFDFGGRTAEALKTVICCGFSQKPSYCSQTLSTQSAATSFSANYTTSSSSSSSSGGCS